MSKNILQALADGLRAVAAAIEADAAEQTAAVEAPEETAPVENAPQEATEALEQETAPVETMEAETAAAAEIISEVENVTKNKPNDFNERLAKAMEILKGRV